MLIRLIEHFMFTKEKYILMCLLAQFYCRVSWTNESAEDKHLAEIEQLVPPFSYVVLYCTVLYQENKWRALLIVSI